MKQLRDYQAKAIQSLAESIKLGNRKVMLHAPTGAGKTVIAAEIIRRARARGNRVMFTVPVISLVDQTVDSFEAHGIEGIGVIQANHWRTNPNLPVQVCSVDSLKNRRNPPPASLVIIDEAHRNNQYMFDLMERWNNVPFIGLSATPWTKGLGKHYEDLVIATTAHELIERGYLTGMEVWCPTKADLQGVKVVAGDYHVTQLSERMQNKILVGDIVENWIRKGENLPTLCFCVDRPHASTMQDAFNKAGIVAEYIDAYTKLEEREEIAKRFHAGQTKVVCNVGCLTTGIDWDVRCIILARPTKSEMLFTQIIGRGLRLADGKERCLIFDHSDTHVNLGMASDIHYDELCDGKRSTSAKRKAEKKEEPKPKECSQCKFIKPAKVWECPKCGFAPKRQSEIEPIAGNLTQFKPNKRNRVATIETKQQFYSELLGYAYSKGYAPGWAANKYREYFGVWPNKLSKRPAEPQQQVKSWIKHLNIKWAKGVKKHENSRASA